MATVKQQCPSCRVTFDAPSNASASVTCPICEATFTPTAKTPPAGPAIPPAQAPAPVPTAPSRGSAGPVLAPVPVAAPRASAGSGRRLAVVGLVLLALIAIAGGLAYALVHLNGEHRPAPATSVADPTPPPATRRVVPPTPPASKLPPGLEAKVNQAIERGVVHLRANLTELVEHAAKPPKDVHPVNYAGMVALEAWTLLTCGASPDDPAIQKAAGILRTVSDQMTRTYNLSLTILFLDSLGDPRDRGLIQALALRLIAGQQPAGNWSYNCPTLTAEEQERFLNYLKSLTWVKDGKADLQLKAGQKLDLPAKLTKAAVVQRLDNQMQPIKAGDNSNTQFAVLGLWVAKRHEVPVAPALSLLDHFFRNTQNKNGSWGYSIRQNVHYGSMTCAALFSLAVTRSLGVEPPGGLNQGDNRADPALANGFRYLGKTIDAPRTGGSQGKIVGANSWGDYYYFWSLERVAMIYGLDQIGGANWYEWAAEAIVANEVKETGSWYDIHRRADSCFALLVLKRINAVQDLTADIKKRIRAEELESAPRKD